MALLQENWVRGALDAADLAAKEQRFDHIVDALRPLPADLFLLLYFDCPPQWASLRAWLPPLPAEKDQVRWAGASGLPLMQYAANFVDDLFAQYGNRKARPKVLDYGCGWGRLIRLLYNRIPVSDIYGVDPWEPSFDRLREFGVHGNFGKVDYVPDGIPFTETFDIVYLLSVFTHISERAQKAILGAIRNRIADDGLLALTIRQANYWNVATWPPEPRRRDALETHLNDGFVFLAHDHSDRDHQTGDYGDTSLTIDYIRDEWKDWKLERVGWRMSDEYQATVFLRPA